MTLRLFSLLVGSLLLLPLESCWAQPSNPKAKRSFDPAAERERERGDQAVVFD